VTSIKCPKTKSASASGGLCPWTPLGALPPDLRYRLTLPRSQWSHAPPDIAG